MGINYKKLVTMEQVDKELEKIVKRADLQDKVCDFRKENPVLGYIVEKYYQLIGKI